MTTMLYGVCLRLCALASLLAVGTAAAFSTGSALYGPLLLTTISTAGIAAMTAWAADHFEEAE